ncbi:MAG: M48 family metalloprotease [Promethearchaeota archaeon]
MNKRLRTLVTATFTASVLCLGIFLFWTGILNWQEYAVNMWFWLFFASFILVLTELLNWTKNGKRSDMADFVVIGFLFFSVYLFTTDILNSLLGAFSIYLIFGLVELKDYSVINRLALITVITYNIIFFAGLVSTKARDTAFSLSFWIILVLGFAFFGRKYIVVWRFMSPQYLTLGLFFIAWLGVTSITEFTSLNLIPWIYAILIASEFLLYFVSGPILGKVLGVKTTDDPALKEMVAEISERLGIKGKVKVGVANYPIINAMAYGPTFDKRICIIAEDLEKIDKEELRGIVAHELAHVRGRHTLILTFISAGDLTFRWIFGIPATYYDYAFTDPEIPMLGFILLNIAIFIVLYIFVRILEARADLSVKKNGMGLNLAKALYTLEGFYASGREIGLNTMLLCDEKILPENRLLDYYETGRYISSYLVHPPKLSVLANLLNSHPPSPVRIASMFTDIKPLEEALFTFTLLSSKKSRKFGLRMSEVLPRVNSEMTKSFQKRFEIPNIGQWNESIARKELFNLVLGRTFIFVPRLGGSLVIGQVDDVTFGNDFTGAVEYIVKKTDGSVETLNPLYFKTIEVWLGGKYLLEKGKRLLKLERIENLDRFEDAEFVFQELERAGEEKPDPGPVSRKVKKFKLPLSLDFLEGLVGRTVFEKEKGTLKMWTCTRYSFDEGEMDFHLEFENEDGDKAEHAGKDLLIFPRTVFLAFYRDEQTIPYERKVVDFLISNGTRVSVYLKKPVNNQESGKVIAQSSEPGAGTITVKNVFGEEKLVSWKEVEGILFEEYTVRFTLKKNESITSKMWYKVLGRVAPWKVFT